MRNRFIHLDLSLAGILIVAGIILGLWLLTLLWQLVLIVVIALMFMSALLPAVDWLDEHHVPRVAAVLLLALTFVVVLGLFGLLVGPPLTRQAKALVDHLPTLRHQVAQFLEQHGGGGAAQKVESFSPGQLGASSHLLSSGRLVLSGFAAAVTTLVVTGYLLYDAKRIKKFIHFATPARYHEHIDHLLRGLQRVVGGYIKGQVITSVLVMIFAYIVLTVMHIPNAIALAVLGGIADIIPIVGVYLFVGPATIAAFGKSVPDAIIVAVLLFGYQELESRLLVQRIYGQTLRLPAIVVVLALLVGAELQGIVGALLALPAAAAIRLFIEYGNEVRQQRTHQSDEVEPVELPPTLQPARTLAGAHGNGSHE